MPKMKTKSGAKKRFSVTAKGKVKFKQACKRHLLTNKSRQMKRHAKGRQILNDSDAGIILNNYLPYSR